MNLPNKITIARICLVPIFVVFLLLSPANTYFKWIALFLFIVASVTDYLDGRIARSRGLVTNFGKFMDPLADKLLVCSALICLIPLGLIPTWVVLITVAREFIISGFRLVAAEKGIVLAASKMAKAKTATQMVMIIVLIMNLPFLKIPGQILIYLSLILTVASLTEYLMKNAHILKGEM